MSQRRLATEVDTSRPPVRWTGGDRPESATAGQPEQQQREKNAREGGEQPAGRSTGEWVSLGLAVAILLSLLGAIVYLQWSGGDRPAEIEVRPLLNKVRPEQDRYTVPVEITNRGDQTAEAVRVKLVIADQAGRGEPAELLVDFLAGGETARGFVTFNRDPSSGLVVDALSYLEP